MGFLFSQKVRKIANYTPPIIERTIKKEEKQMANGEHKFYAPTKWQDLLWRFLDGHTDSLRLSLKQLDSDAVHAAANCKAALRRMRRYGKVRTEPDAIVVYR